MSCDILFSSLRDSLQEGPCLKGKGRASDAARIVVLTWRSLLIMSRDWKYFWIRLVLYMLIAVSIGTIFTDIGHSLSSVMVSVVTLLCFDSSNWIYNLAILVSTGEDFCDICICIVCHPSKCFWSTRSDR